MCINQDHSYKCSPPVLLTGVAGFTLIELVSVIVLLGILSVTIAPRFMTKGGFSEYAVQDEIVSAVRLSQQRAMYEQDENVCYRLLIASNVFGAQRGARALPSDPYSFNWIGPDEDWRNGIDVESGVTVADKTVYFDGLGNALNNCGGASTDFTISITGETSLEVFINAVGFIQAR